MHSKKSQRPTGEIRVKPKFKIPLWLRATISIIILGLLARNFDVTQAFEVLKAVRIDFLALTIFIAILLRFFAAYRWYILLHGKNPVITFGGVVRLTFMSNLMGYFLPAGLGQEAVRILGLSRSTSDLPLSVSSALLDRLFAVIALVIIVLGGMAISLPAGMPDVIVKIAWVSLVFLGFVTITIMHRWFRRVLDKIFKLIKLERLSMWLIKLYKCLDAYKCYPWLIIWAMMMALIFQLLRALIALTGAWALGLNVPIVPFMVLILVIFFIKQIPISIGGLGVQEAGFIYLLGFVGVTPVVAFSLSLLLYLTTFVIVLPPGVWFYVQGGLSLHKSDFTP